MFAPRTPRGHATARLRSAGQPCLEGLNKLLGEISFCRKEHLPAHRVKRDQRSGTWILRADFVAQVCECARATLPFHGWYQASQFTEEPSQRRPPRRDRVLGRRKKKKLSLQPVRSQVLELPTQVFRRADLGNNTPGTTRQLLELTLPGGVGGVVANGAVRWHVILRTAKRHERTQL